MGVLATRANLARVLLVVLMILLTGAVVRHATATKETGPASAMTAECHRAYRGYMEASDPSEADFWAESWMTFGCETGGGYWA
jgi:hypothetical protein